VYTTSLKLHDSCNAFRRLINCKKGNIFKANLTNFEISAIIPNMNVIVALVFFVVYVRSRACRTERTSVEFYVVLKMLREFTGGYKYT